MTQAISNARMDIYEPGNTSSTPDLEITKSDIISFEIKIRMSDRKDTATAEVHNDNGQYTDNASIDLDSGQKVSFYVSTEFDIDTWGDNAWGDGGWGGENLRWTGMIRDLSFHYNGPNSSVISMELEDFVFSVMSKRLVYDSFTDKPVAGNSNSILNTAISNNAPEINLNFIEDFTSSTSSITADGTNLLDLALKMAKRVDAVMYSGRDRLYFEDLGSKSAKFSVTGSDISYFEVKSNDIGLTNVVRVDGGTDTAIDDEQTTQDGYTTVTDSSRATFQVSTRKSSIAHLELWTKTTGTEESVTVRIQKDDAGSPIAPNDKTSDIAGKTLNFNFLDDDGFTTFLIPNHTLPEPNPWILVETDGSSGQDIGINTSTSTPAYKSWYSYEITTRQADADSINNYRKRESRVKDDSIRTVEEARAVSNEKLNHDSVPEKEITLPAESQRMFNLSVGEVVTLDFPRERATGDYIIRQKSETYQGNIYDATMVGQEVSSV